MPVLTTTIVIARIFFDSVRFDWFLRGHKTPNNETVSRQKLWAGNIAKSMTSEGNSALLPANVTKRFNEFPASKFPANIYNKSLKDWSLEKQLILIPSNLLRFSGNKMNCLPRDQCLILTSFPGQATDVYKMYSNQVRP